MLCKYFMWWRGIVSFSSHAVESSIEGREIRNRRRRVYHGVRGDYQYCVMLRLIWFDLWWKMEMKMKIETRTDSVCLRSGEEGSKRRQFLASDCVVRSKFRQECKWITSSTSRIASKRSTIIQGCFVRQRWLRYSARSALPMREDKLGIARGLWRHWWLPNKD
jgi:hypothetical protein